MSRTARNRYYAATTTTSCIRTPILREAARAATRMGVFDSTRGVWDLLFGTWFLPKGHTVASLGLINRNYPMGFLTQLRSPFDFGLDKRTDPEPAAPAT